MYPSVAMARAPARATLLFAATAIIVMLWFVLSALATPFDHDESQYVAGAYFSTHLLVFRDFPYLQPPLHSWLFAPLAWLFSAHMVLAMRLATAATALATLAVLWGCQRIAGIARNSAGIAVLLIAATATFQFCGSVVRNDMLPTLLATLAMFVALRSLRDWNVRGWFLAGLLFGLAIATKLSFAPVGLSLGLFVICTGGHRGLNAGAWLAAGALCGMAPIWLMWMIAPESFLYGVLTFGTTAPHAWYAANGAAGDLTMTRKAAKLPLFLVQGPALIALILLTGNWLLTRRRVRSPGRRMAVWMVGGGLVGATLPTPSHVQYMIPLFPPLAVALGYLLEDARRWPFVSRKLLLGLLCIATIPGMFKASRNVARMAQAGSPILQATDGAHWAGAKVRQLAPDQGSGDDIVTLSPHMVADSGLRLDPRLAAGPFVYRSGWTVGSDRARRIRAMIPANMSDLDRDPPEAILVGYEKGTRKLPLRPDDGLIAYAESRGYRPITMPDGIGRLFIRRVAGRPQSDRH